jgi:hypothetical protein
VGTAALGCPPGDARLLSVHQEFIRATSQLNAGTDFGSGFFLAPKSNYS